MKILLVDDHKIVRAGLAELVKHITDSVIIEEASTGKDALYMISRTSYDLILLDISLPDINGLEVLQNIKVQNNSQKVLILSMHPQEQYAIRALNLGASGYLTKDTASEELITAIKVIIEGKTYITPSLASNIALHLNDDFSKALHETLSNREFDIFLKIATGKSLKDIAAELYISDKTVSTYRSRIMEKMNMQKNAEITEYCIRINLI